MVVDEGKRRGKKKKVFIRPRGKRRREKRKETNNGPTCSHTRSDTVARRTKCNTVCIGEERREERETVALDE